MGQTAAAEYELAVRCLGAVVWHLKYCLMDQELLSLRSFTIYKPVDADADAEHSLRSQPASFTVGNVHMVHCVIGLLSVFLSRFQPTCSLPSPVEYHLLCLQHLKYENACCCCLITEPCSSNNNNTSKSSSIRTMFMALSL